MKAVVTVIGKDTVGIIAKVSQKCAECNANVLEVSQHVLQDLFAMVMLVDVEKLNCGYADFSEKLRTLGEEMGMAISAMHEDIFNSMHRI